MGKVKTGPANPNYFLYAHFSKLINNGKAQPGSSNLEIMNQLQPQVYANVVAPLNSNPFGVAFRRLEDRIEGQNVPYELHVLSYQQNIASLARAYKNQAQQLAQ